MIEFFKIGLAIAPTRQARRRGPTSLLNIVLRFVHDFVIDLCRVLMRTSL